MLEEQYARETPIEYRKDYGQFFTPALVARLMAQWVIKGEPKSILDPAFGLGVFYEAISSVCNDQPLQFIGYEIDERILRYFQLNKNQGNIRLVNEDYLMSAPSLYDGIICNPPYMRFQKFLNRHRVLPRIEKYTGKRMKGYSNISSVFLMKALNELAPNGRLAFILPFEFFNAGYGENIKKYLLERNLLKQIVIFQNEKEIFDESITTVSILFCKNDARRIPIKITQVNQISEIRDLLDIEKFYQVELTDSDLLPNRKWTPIINSAFCGSQASHGFSQFSNFGKFKRGIATGANEFFALSKSKIEKWDLRDKYVIRCLTRSPHIRKAVFSNEDFSLLYNNNKSVYCLNVTDISDPEVRRYIKYGEMQGFHKRFLTSQRSPWYKLESRESAPIMIGVFNRGRVKVIRNYTDAVSFTCFHSFYPNVFGFNYADKLFVYLLSDYGQSIIRQNGRSYGSGLEKFEPGDLNECRCPSQKQLDAVDDSKIRDIIEVAKTDTNLAIQMSNAVFKNSR